jgi:biopolymer transport protein ExbB
MAFNARASRAAQFAPAVAGALREGKLDEAIKIADRYKKSHLAKVVWPVCRNSRRIRAARRFPGEEIEASKRALERSEAIVHAELKRGVSALATIGSTAPFVGLFGTVVGIINAFKTMAAQRRLPVSAPSPAVFRKPS